MSDKKCSFNNCSKKYHCRGYCVAHYRNFIRNGFPEPKPKPVRLCTIEGCGNKHKTHGYCRLHYERLVRTGDPNQVRIAQGSIDECGYVRVYDARKRKVRKQHRVLVEAAIGRDLSSNEAVHHINGDKADNRLENLCIMPRGEHTGIHNSERRNPNNTDLTRQCCLCNNVLPIKLFRGRDYRCRKCNAERIKTERQSRVANGKCALCNKALRGERYRCNACKTKRRKSKELSK